MYKIIDNKKKLLEIQYSIFLISLIFNQNDEKKKQHKPIKCV